MPSHRLIIIIIIAVAIYRRSPPLLSHVTCTHSTLPPCLLLKPALTILFRPNGAGDAGAAGSVQTGRGGSGTGANSPRRGARCNKEGGDAALREWSGSEQQRLLCLPVSDGYL